MQLQSGIQTALPHRQPDRLATRILLYAIRRIGGGGLHEAGAANAFFNLFGKGFQRPLTLLRALMADMSRLSARPITLAPCCCPRMTTDERMLIDLLARVCTRPASAALLLDDLLAAPRSGAVLPTAHLLAAAFADRGHPLGD